jgi:colanic acid/amylovoran biosynthesis protein
MRKVIIMNGGAEIEDQDLPMRILVLWSDNQAANLGLRVLAQGNAELMRRALGPDVKVDFQDFGPGDSEVSFGTKAILRDIYRKSGPIKSKLSNYDLIVDSGAGDSFADIYGFKRLSFIVYAHATVRRLKIPIVMGPQTIGPFNSRLGRFFARRSLKQMKVILARDSESARYASSLGVTVSGSATDVVFALPRSSVAKTRDVVLNVSGLLWFGDEHVDSAFYREQVRTLILGLREAGRKVTLLPHVVHSKSGNDDIDASRAAIESLPEDSRPELVIPTSLSEAREIVGSAVVVVGARMHACLNALSMGTPAISWGYSRKFGPLMKDIGWDVGLDLRTSPNAGEATVDLILSTDWLASAEKLNGLRTTIDARLDVAVDAIRTLRDNNVAVG